MGRIAPPALVLAVALAAAPLAPLPVPATEPPPGLAALQAFAPEPRT